MNSVALALTVAAGDGTEGAEFGKASPIGLLVIIVLLVAVFLLIRSMNKQLKKLPESFDVEHPEADQAFDEGTDQRATDTVDETASEPVDADESTNRTP